MQQPDAQVCWFIEALWVDGHQKSLAADVLSGISFFLKRKRVLCGGWHLLTTWQRREGTCQARPLPLFVVHGMTGLAVARQRLDFALITLLAFSALLRTSEMLQLRREDIFIYHGQISIFLSHSQSGSRFGVQEAVTIQEPVLASVFAKYVNSLGLGQQFFREAAWKYRTLFQEYLVCLGFQAKHFQPYGLRRGGATHRFSSDANLQSLLVLGRWRQLQTAKIYIKPAQEQVERMIFAEGQQNNLARFSTWLSRLAQ